MCKSAFKVYARINSEVEICAEITGGHSTIAEYQSTVLFEVYKSTSEHPSYTDKDCSVMIGKLKIKIPDRTKEKRHILVKMTFGNNVIKVSATDIKTREECETFLELV